MNEIDKAEVIDKIVNQEGFKIIQKEAEKIFKKYPQEECLKLAKEFYESKEYQVQELGIFIYGFIADKYIEVVEFLKSQASQNPDWRVQEILAMAFDCYCKTIGYEQALPTIKEWLEDDCPNTRRAVTEGLRIWTGRPYFKENPEEAIKLLSNLKNDESEYVRKSVGNSIRDISRKYPELVKTELDSWELSNKKITQVYKLASKIVNKNS